MTVDVGDYAQAQYEFQAESTGDLNLTVGDVVRITDSLDKNWLIGEKVGYGVPAPSGTFPATFVEPLRLPSVRTGQKVFLVLEDFLSEQTGDLELTKGEVIVGVEAVDHSWWRGKNGPLKGIFPLSFVTELWLDDGLRSRSFSARSSSFKSRSGSLAESQTSSIGGYDGVGIIGSFDSGVTKVAEPTFARALVNVSPQLDGELAFQLGDLIEITEIIDGDWFFGRCRGKEGLVSAMCVELLEDDGGGGGVNDRLSPHSEVVDTMQHILPHVPYIPLKSLENMDEDDYRLRNISNGSYTSENTRSHDAEIVPYAQVLYSFAAQARSELSLQSGQIVTLLRHLDSDWTEGELDGQRGIFPTSFVEIVVDCPHVDSSSPSQVKDIASQLDQSNMTLSKDPSGAVMGLATCERSEASGLLHQQSLDNGKAEEVQNDCYKDPEADEKVQVLTRKPVITAQISEVLEISSDIELGLVLHTFEAQVAGDVTVTEGETVEVICRVDDNWLEVRTDAGHSGLVPLNHIEIIGLWTKEQRVSPSPANSSTKPLNGTTASGGSDAESERLDNLRLASVYRSVSTTQHGLVSYTQDSYPASAKANVGYSFEGDSSPNRVEPIITEASSKAPALPSKKPSLPPKPNLGPKPSLRAKPLQVSNVPVSPISKPILEQLQPVIATKPIRPPALITAKPFSSLPIAKPHHVVSPTERRLSMSSLDAIVEGEIEKAKSRSSSQTSDMTIEQDSTTLDASDQCMVTQGDQSNTTSSNTLTVSSTSSLLGKQDQQLLFQNSDSAASQVSKDHLSFEDNFSASPVVSAHSLANPQTITGVRPSLISSMSVSEDRYHSSADRAQRRKSASYAEHANRARQAASSSTALSEGGKQSAFVNKAFEMDVDEGKLVDLADGHKSNSFHSSPRRVAPPRPPNTIVIPSVQSSKTKAPPPRPTGPRIAPAPSKIPLVPAPAAPTTAKLIPKRPAPRAPCPTTVNNNHSHKTTGYVQDILTASSASQVSGQPSSKLAFPAPRPAPQPPQRQAPRPVSLAQPPPRSLPPRPADLITFSPEEESGPKKDQGISEETTRAMVKDVKAKLEENKSDIKDTLYVFWTRPPPVRRPL